MLKIRRVRLIPTTIVFAIAALFLQSVSAEEIGCAKDTDCKGERVCYEGQCLFPDSARELEEHKIQSLKAPPVQPSQPKTKSRLIVRADSDSDDVPHEGLTVLVDGVAVGVTPWEGNVEPGVHTVSLRGLGYRSKEIETRIWPDKVRLVELELLGNDQFDIGVFYVGLVYEYNVGKMRCDACERSTTVQLAPNIPGLELGFRIPVYRAWFDVGATIGPELIRKTDDDLGGIIGIGEWPLALKARFQFPLLGPRLYFSAEVAPGVVPARVEWAVTLAVRAGLSIYLNDWWEIRVDPIGARFTRTTAERIWLEDDATRYMSVRDQFVDVLFSPSVGILLRI